MIANQPSHLCVNSWREVNSVASFIQGEMDAIEPRLLKIQFRTAREAMQASIGLQKVVFPTVPSDQLAKANNSAGRSQTVTKPLLSQSVKSKVDEPRDLDTEPDPSLQIPGELVLAREPKAKHVIYWPGRVLDFSPKDPNDEKDFPGYIIQIFPEPVLPQKLRRSYFCTTIEDQFLTCKVCPFRTSSIQSISLDDTKGWRMGNRVC